MYSNDTDDTRGTTRFHFYTKYPIDRSTDWLTDSITHRLRVLDDAFVSEQFQNASAEKQQREERVQYGVYDKLKNTDRFQQSVFITIRHDFESKSKPENETST